VSVDDPYVYPGTRVLVNKLGITDQQRLQEYERKLTVQRHRLELPRLVLSEAGFRRMHAHLFGPLYDWAGQYRKMDLAVASLDSEGRQRTVVFATRAGIKPRMRELFSDLERQAFLQVTSVDRFAGEAAVVAGRLIQIHPFRDGNGRTTRYFLDELARRAGHKLNLGVAPNQHVRDRWMSASEEFLRPYPNYTPMAQFLSDTIKGRVQSAEHRIVLSEAITKIRQLRPAAVLEISRQLQEAITEARQSPDRPDRRERAAALGALDKAIKGGWPVNELEALKAVGVTDIRSARPVSGDAVERVAIIGRAAERAILDLPERERTIALERLGRHRGADQ
jgi:cell filamentation protein